MKTPQDQSVAATRTTDPETTKAAADGLRKDAETTAREVGDTVAREAKDRADKAKDGVADDISSVSDALRRASDDLRNGSPQERSFGAAADALADFADTVRNKDLGEMVDDMGDFARRNPMAFLGGAALLGFAGVRMAKASQRARLADDAGGAGSGSDHRDVYAQRNAARPASAAAPVTATGRTGGDGVTGLSETGEHP